MAEMPASIHILPIAGVFGSSASAVGYGAWNGHTSVGGWFMIAGALVRLTR